MGFQQKTWKKAPFGVGYIFFQWNFEVMVATIWTKNMFRKIIWANFVGYNSTRHYIIHNTVYFVQSLTIEQKTPTFCCWSMLRTTLECFFFFKFWNFTRIVFMPIHFCRVSGCSKIIGHQLLTRMAWKPWSESPWIGRPLAAWAATKYSIGRKLSGGVWCCFWGVRMEIYWKSEMLNCFGGWKILPFF